MMMWYTNWHDFVRYQLPVLVVTMGFVGVSDAMRDPVEVKKPSALKMNLSKVDFQAMDCEQVSLANKMCYRTMANDQPAVLLTDKDSVAGK